MSKLSIQFQKLKEKNPNKIYLFKNGIFFIALNEDAKTLSKLFDFKILRISDDLERVGFPEKRIDYYSQKLLELNLDFVLIFPNNIVQYSYDDFKTNSNLKKIIESILILDIDNITGNQALQILDNLKKEILILKNTN